MNRTELIEIITLGTEVKQHSHFYSYINGSEHIECNVYGAECKLLKEMVK